MNGYDFSFLFQFKFTYLLTISLISIFLLLRGLLFIRKEKRRRLKEAKKMEYTDAVVSTSTSPEQDKEYEADQIVDRRKAVQSIETRFEFMQRFYIPLVIFVATVLLSLPFLPTLPATYLSLFTGLVAGVIGFAAKPVIENAIAGMVLTFSQPLRINDTVIIDGHYGTVEKINSLFSVIKIWNWRRLVIPNHKLLQKEIENLTLGDEEEWAHIDFFVEPQVDIKKVQRLACEAMNSPYLLPTEKPSFWVMGVEKDAIHCWVAGWASDPAEAWALKSATRKNLIDKFNKNNIGFQLSNTNIKVSPETLGRLKNKKHNVSGNVYS